MKAHAGLYNILANGLTCHTLVSVRLLDSNLNVHVMPENPGQKDIQLAFKLSPKG